MSSQYASEGAGGLLDLERHQVTFNFLGPGIRYELGLFRNLSASTSLSPAFGYYQSGYTFGFAWHTRVRYYHNFKQRKDLGNTVTGNSANYIGPATTFFWDPLQIANNLDADKGFSLAFYGAVYGLQRTNKQGFNINIELGYGYYDGFGVPSGHGALLNFTLGWVATKRKSTDPIKVPLDN
ncbi:hypothetical protein [Psychroflexus aurantiacus]|nr:hypothetical protein [Psychroflexus aurantiacus]